MGALPPELLAAPPLPVAFGPPTDVVGPAVVLPGVPLLGTAEFGVLTSFVLLLPGVVEVLGSLLVTAVESVDPSLPHASNDSAANGRATNDRATNDRATNGRATNDCPTNDCATEE